MQYVNVAFNIPVKTPFTYTVPEDITSSIGRLELGVRVVAPVGKRSLAGFVVDSDAEPPPRLELRPLTRVVDADPLFDSTYLEIAEWVAGMYVCTLGEALAAMVPSGRRESELGGLASQELAGHEQPHTLSTEQRKAIDRVMSARGGSYYVYGITGSGKTEVFLRVAEATIAEGRGVIYLVPEIALTRQMERTVRARFGDRAAVLHSRLTPSRRLTEWRRIRSGAAMFVVGARSAVFAPLPELGLIVVDEEHEATYKSGAAPRYHARQVAMRRCAQGEARLVLGSATPSVEAFREMRAGRLTELRLSERQAGGRPPTTSVVDMRNERGVLSGKLVEELEQAKREGRQSILFLNRRGFSHVLFCRSCGFRFTCRNCSVGLTYHKKRRQLVCHYCGYRRQPADSCPECGSLDIGAGGFGTEQVQEEVAKRFPTYRVARIDTDTVRKRGVLEEALDSFRDGQIDILLGTQMVAKGLNFPGVKVVGIVLADTGLAMPDFRAAERTFSLIVQVSGRAGRFAPDGTVVVQTFHPGHGAVRKAADGEPESWYEEELAVREELRFPPFARLIRLVFRSRSGERAWRAAQDFASRVAPRITSTEGEILGPVECPLETVSRNHRRHVLIRALRFGRCHRAVRAAFAEQSVPAGVFREVDIDPTNLL